MCKKNREEQSQSYTKLVDYLSDLRNYKIKKTPQGDLIFDVRWQTLANFVDITQYEHVTMGEFLSNN